MGRRLGRLAILAALGAAVLFLLYPLLHEAGHALVTVLLGGRIRGLSLEGGLPQVESGLADGAPGWHVALISLGGLLLPVLVCLPLTRCRGYVGYAVAAVLLISAISCAVELAVAVQFAMGDPVPGDDVTLFMTWARRPGWAYPFTGGLFLLSAWGVLRTDLLSLLRDLA